ncbi:MAG: hypothetical protein WD068_02850 [Candidatus Babeliales bacterium]
MRIPRLIRSVVLIILCSATPTYTIAPIVGYILAVVFGGGGICKLCYDQSPKFTKFNLRRIIKLICDNHIHAQEDLAEKTNYATDLAYKIDATTHLNVHALLSLYHKTIPESPEQLELLLDQIGFNEFQKITVARKMMHERLTPTQNALKGWKELILIKRQQIKEATQLKNGAPYFSCCCPPAEIAINYAHEPQGGWIQLTYKAFETFEPCEKIAPLRLLKLPLNSSSKLIANQFTHYYNKTGSNSQDFHLLTLIAQRLQDHVNLPSRPMHDGCQDSDDDATTMSSSLLESFNSGFQRAKKHFARAGGALFP